MAQGSNRGGTSGKGGGRNGGGRGKEFGSGADASPSRSSRSRGKAAPIKKPFPLGFAAGVTLLVLFLGGILTYAIANTGAGFTTALEQADEGFPGIRVDDNLDQFHINPVDGARVDYPGMDTRPPDGGNHSGFWQDCGVYTEPVVSEHAVHSLEHGAVWVTYRPDLPADQVAELDGLINGNPYGLLSPYEGQTAPVMATSWGRQVSAETAGDGQLADFVDTYADGPQKREVGASCQGQINQPGTAPFVQSADGTYVPGPADGPLVPSQGETEGGTEPGSPPQDQPVAPPADPADPGAPAVPGAPEAPVVPGAPEAPVVPVPPG